MTLMLCESDDDEVELACAAGGEGLAAMASSGRRGLVSVLVVVLAGMGPGRKRRRIR